MAAGSVLLDSIITSEGETTPHYTDRHNLPGLLLDLQSVVLIYRDTSNGFTGTGTVYKWYIRGLFK